MNMQEIYQAYWTGEVLEYHLMGMEQGADNLAGPGWYSCIIDELYENGDVEISFEKFPHLSATVLRKNISIAFRKKQEATS